MKILGFFITTLTLSFLLAFSPAHAQDKPMLKQANNRIDAAQSTILKLLSRTSIDKTGKDLITRFVVIEIDSLQKVIKLDKSLSELEQVTAINCASYFLETLKDEIGKKPMDMMQINNANTNFIPLWGNLRTGQSCDKIIGELGIRSANLMTIVFKEYPQASRIKDISVLKSLALTPEKILNFLETSPGYIFRDTLIFIYANSYPERFINSITSSKDPEIQKYIDQNPYPLVKSLIAVSKEKNFINYLPFIGLLAQQKITMADIDKARATPTDYFKLIVDAEMDNSAKRANGETPIFFLPVRQYLKQYAIKYYTDVINSLHEEPNEKARYFVLDGLRPQDLYFILVSGETELYTSSYLYTYRKLISAFTKNNNDSLLQLVNYNRYRKFLSMAGRYNTLSAYMKGMPRETSIGIMKRFMTSLEKTEGNGVDETITVAETFPGIMKDKELAALTLQEIKINFNRSRNNNDYHGMKLYKILTTIFAAVNNNEAGKKTGLSDELAVYYNVTLQSLKDRDGSINQLVLFYGDDDGKGSFNSFMGNFTDAGQWAIEKNTQWVTIKSKKLYPVTIYANLPVSDDDGQDIKAQEQLKEFLKTNGISPHILIHRGHSYHLANSIKSVTEATRLAILGSCGGYTEIFQVLENSLAAQVISTKQVGSKQVNEPLLKLINNRLLNGKDLQWADIWAELDNQLKGNKLAYDYLQEYVPPYKNIALLVATLYNNDPETVTVQAMAITGN